MKNEIQKIMDKYDPWFDQDNVHAMIGEIKNAI